MVSWGRVTKSLIQERNSRGQMEFNTPRGLPSFPFHNEPVRQPHLLPSHFRYRHPVPPRLMPRRPVPPCSGTSRRATIRPVPPCSRPARRARKRQRADSNLECAIMPRGTEGGRALTTATRPTTHKMSLESSHPPKGIRRGIDQKERSRTE